MSVQDSAHAFERQASETRRRLNTALDELTYSLTPGRVLDEVMSFSRAGGGTFLKGVGNAASTNPIPTLLIGAGLAMFLSGKGRVDFSSLASRDAAGSTRRPSSGSDGESVMDKASGAFEATRDGARRTLHDAESGIVSAGRAMADSALAAGEQAASTLGAARDVLGAGAATVADAAAAGAGQVASGVRAAETAVERTLGAAVGQAADMATAGEHLVEDWVSRISQLAKEQPLLVAAAGALVGAAIATLLPKTAAEDSLYGETREALKQAVGDIAAEQYEKASDTLSHLVDNVKAAAEHDGISTDAAANVVRETAKKVERVIGAAGEAASEALKNQLGEAESVAKPTSGMSSNH